MTSCGFLRSWAALAGLPLLVLMSCGKGEEDATEAAVLSLDGPEIPEEGGGAESVSSPDSLPKPPVATEAAAPAEDGQATPASAEVRHGAAGPRALDAWHRSLESGRDEVLDRLSGEAAAALEALGRGLQGEEKSYRAALRLELPQELGPAFADYAQAYAEGDVEQLATVLQPTPAPGPAWMVWTEALVHLAAKRENDRVATPALGRLVRAMLQLGYARDRVLALRPVAESLGRRAGRWMPADEYAVRPGQSLYHVRAELRQAGQKLNYRWIADFNEKPNYNLAEGEVLKIPRQELHIEVWRGARVVVVFAGDRPVRIYPCSVGREGEETPLGEFTVGLCEKQPVYYGVSPAVPYGNPENPLGERWLGFEEKTSYGLHGTNSETTIGSFETEGCVRMHNADVIELFDLVPTGTRVVIHD